MIVQDNVAGHLLPLPLTGFAYFTECERTVGDATCVRIDHSSYAARPAPIGSRVLVRLFEHHLEIRDRATLALLRSHPRARRRGSVLLPPEERPYGQRGLPQIFGGGRKPAHS